MQRVFSTTSGPFAFFLVIQLTFLTPPRTEIMSTCALVFCKTFLTVICTILVPSTYFCMWAFGQILQVCESLFCPFQPCVPLTQTPVENPACRIGAVA